MSKITKTASGFIISFINWAALVWSVLYLVLGFYWLYGGGGFPFGTQSDPSATISALSHVTREGGALYVVSVAGLATIIAILLLMKVYFLKAIHLVLCSGLSLLIIFLLLVVPDYRVLVAVAYAPLFLIGAPFGWPAAHFSDAIPWPVINQLLCILGGVLWSFALLIYLRRRRKACLYCGRRTRASSWTSPESAKKWGTWAVVVAAIVPVFYAATRWAWGLGIPLGIPFDFWQEGYENGMWWAGAGLASMAVGGAILTIGLIRPWGEIFPRWTLFLKGRRVPPAVAIVPATFVSILVTSAGLMFVRLVLEGSFPFLSTGWGTVVPELLWPIWGITLAIATLAYYYRRRGRCSHCGRM
jgi:hypothetical protein